MNNNKEQAISKFLDAFFEKFQDEDIDFKLMFLIRKATDKILNDVRLNGTKEQKEEIIKALEKILEIGEI